MAHGTSCQSPPVANAIATQSSSSDPFGEKKDPFGEKDPFGSSSADPFGGSGSVGGGSEVKNDPFGAPSGGDSDPFGGTSGGDTTSKESSDGDSLYSV